MAKKNITPEVEIIENIHNETMEEIMSTRYATYAKYVIQDRAIPDARDGLKPVQRRIIYSMYKDGNIFTRPTRKCAHTVGAVMGKYHPHGDSSIYEALVHMSQDWKVSCPLIDFQGNNGSIDADPAAAYRYTEARLSQIAEEMIRDIEKDTVEMALTFDDSDFEPVVMPSRFPNLLVNGAEGIAVAMATEIPTHNLKEVIDAVIYRINHVRVEPLDLMEFVKGPDFPTGGIIYNSNGLQEIYQTGRGRIEIAAKTEIVNSKELKAIVITELPYNCIKKQLVYEIDMLRYNRTLPGIQEVRDESDRHGLRIVIEIKKDANIDVIHQYLMTKSSLKTSYSANMVAIVNGSPKTMNLLDFVDAYIEHQVDVITKRSHFDLKKSESRLHIVNGLIKAISIVDKVVETIRKSKDKQDAKINLQNEYQFSEPQSEAIVMLQLYKLSNTDITTLENEKLALENNIEFLNGILTDRNKLDRLLISDLKEIAKKYGNERKTEIIEKGESQTIDMRDLIAKENVMIAVTRDGYIKYSSIKSYKSSGDNALPGMKDGDVCVYSGQAFTTDYLLCFTNKGNFLYIPVHEINENKWKDEGKHISYLINLNPNEKIVRAYTLEKFRNDLFFVLTTKRGQIKRLRLSDFSVIRYSKPIMCMKLLQDDELQDVTFTTGDSNLVIFLSDGNGTMFNENDLPSSMSLKSGGLKGIARLNGANVVNVLAYDRNDTNGKVLLITDKICIRIYEVNKTILSTRPGKSCSIYKMFKSDEHVLVLAKKLNTSLDSNDIKFLTNTKTIEEIKVNDYHLTPMDRYAKQNDDIKISNKIKLVIPFYEAEDYIDSKIKSHEIPMKEEDKITEEQLVGPSQEKIKEEKIKEEEEKGYTQISIFDDLDEN